jgi:hypothetical protein
LPWHLAEFGFPSNRRAMLPSEASHRTTTKPRPKAREAVFSDWRSARRLRYVTSKSAPAQKGLDRTEWTVAKRELEQPDFEALSAEQADTDRLVRRLFGTAPILTFSTRGWMSWPPCLRRRRRS